jgi:NADH:ubiquinone oxidoreductase subunit 5 (subunit L)/multisubunit Na+/H+ antiporter MnhA subunit
MQTTQNTKQYADRKIWFSMWFLSAIVTFGLAFFPLFYRLVDGRNRHLQKEAEIEAKLADYFKNKGKQPPQAHTAPKKRNATLWAASIILIIPAFIIMYQVTKDLAAHEKQEDTYLAAVLPERVFMPQTIPQTTYVLITIVTLGVGGVYWLYKIVNQYNLHYKADLQVEKEINRLLEEENVKHM